MSITHSEVKPIICSEVKTVSRQRLQAFRDLMLDQGVWAEVKVGGEQLRLFSKMLAVQESVHNMNARNWIAPSKTAELSNGEKTERRNTLEAYLWKAANLELPSLTWKSSV
jgi:hypothetical protein